LKIIVIVFDKFIYIFILQFDLSTQMAESAFYYVWQTPFWQTDRHYNLENKVQLLIGCRVVEGVVCDKLGPAVDDVKVRLLAAVVHEGEQRNVVALN
jgi:hypothetical protein